jgi:hypothetical protein
MKRNRTHQELLNTILITSIVAVLAIGCENREINGDENMVQTYSDLPLDDIEQHFQKIWLDDVQYFILERDRNNPHEGFGFMALKGNVLINKQDSIIAYLQTSMQAQAEILSILKKTSVDDELSSLQSQLQIKMNERKFVKR